MSGLLGTIVLVIAVIAIANIAKKIQDGEISPFMIKKYQRMIPGIVVIALIILVLASSIVSVPVGHRMVVYNKVTSTFRQPLQPGFGLVLPLINERFMYDVRTQVYTMSGIISEGNVQRADAIEVLSSDGLKMDLDITIQFRCEDTKVNELHDEIGKDYINKIIRPTVREGIRIEFAQHEATEAFSSKREDIEKNLEQRLLTSLEKYYMLLQEVQIRNIQLPPLVATAIEEKKKAQQEAERMEYILELAEKEKEEKIIRAEAEAAEIEIVNEALSNNPDYLKWLSIDKLNPNIELVITDGKTILDLDAYRKE